MKKTVMREYARLAIKKGLNLQKGQGLQIFVCTDQEEFAVICVDEAYKAGAKWVKVEWINQDIEKLDYRYQTLTTMKQLPDWQKARFDYLAKELPCRLHILSEDPDGLKGVNSKKVMAVKAAHYPVTRKYMEAIDNNHQWCIIGVPGKKWAKKVFPELRTSAAVERLWDEILNAARAKGDAFAAWDAHNAELKAHSNRLNAAGLDSLHITSPNGTDLTIGLIPEARFESGGGFTKQGVFYNPNMPTEEVYTTPNRMRCTGRAVSSMPLSYQGRLIENFSIDFKDGRAVSFTAEKGEDVLGALLDSDENVRYLGEVAIVPCSSPIYKSGIMYYNTLYDENAACHLALGKGFGETIEGYENMTNEQLEGMGVNSAMLHIDFMIGTPQTRITGKDKNGNEVLLFDNGEFVD